MTTNSTFASKILFATLLLAFQLSTAKSLDITPSIQWKNAIATATIKNIQEEISTDKVVPTQDRCNSTELLSSVIYTSFVGHLSDKTVFLDWKTALETNSAYYEVERSFDAANFKTAGLVLDGFAGEQGSKSYKFKDNSNELRGKTQAHYRLKLIENDGTVIYSAVVTLSVNTSTAE